MSLSESIYNDKYLCLEYLYVVDVKKFIKELKENSKNRKIWWEGGVKMIGIPEEEIDELAGEALT